MAFKKIITLAADHNGVERKRRDKGIVYQPMIFKKRASAASGRRPSKYFLDDVGAEAAALRLRHQAPQAHAAAKAFTVVTEVGVAALERLAGRLHSPPELRHLGKKFGSDNVGAVLALN